MGNHQSRPEDRLRSINKEVSSIRTSVRLSRQNISKVKKEYIVASLAKYSSDVSSLHGKVKRRDMEDALKNISETMQDVLKTETTELDSGAVESNSFVNVPLSHKRSNSLGSLRSIKKPASNNSVPVNRLSPSIRDIEGKVDELKSQIATAISNRDTRQLKVHQETLVVLTAELDVIPLSETDTILNKRKESINKKVVDLYRKSTKALKELKQDDNNQPKSKSQKKQKALNDLGEIEVQLAKNESLLDSMVKQKDADFFEVRNSIIENNKKLAAVDMVDKDVTERVVLLSQKLSETVKNLDKIMAKKEFESKFAKYLENYERIMRNCNPNSNPENTLNNLQILLVSLENLEEINENTKNRKKDLLNNINLNIGKISETLDQQSDENIVKDIVEDNVILRKHLKSSDKEFTVIDQFINYWNNVKINFNVNSYTDLSLLRIDSVLEDMQVSINDLRIAIAAKCNTNPPNNLNKKRSQSVPKLNSKDSNDERKSENILENNLIKTSAKIYNIPKHEVQNMNAQQTSPNNRFSKVEQIKLQVHYIKEKVDETSNKNMLKSKLEEYQKRLAEYVNDRNQTVSNNANLVLEEINEISFKILLENFREKIEGLSSRTQSLKGAKNNEESLTLKEELIKIGLDLESLNIQSKYESLLQERQRLLNEVRINTEILQESNVVLRRHENFKQVNSKLQELKGKVNKFSGIYGGVQYNQIERGLNKLLLNIGELSDKTVSNEISQEIEKLSKILEQRASHAQSFRRKTDREVDGNEQVGMAKIKQDLLKIKLDIDRTSENKIENFIGFQTRLDLINFELSQIVVRSNENLAKEKDIYVSEAQTLMNVVDAKISLGQKSVQWPQTESNAYQKNDVNKEIEQFEKAFDDIKDKISNSTSEQARNTFYQFANDIRKLREKLHSYKFIPQTELALRQANIIEEMNSYIEILEKEAADINFIYNMERRTNELQDLFIHGPQNRLLELESELDTVRNGLNQYTLSSSNETLKANKSALEQQTDVLKQKLEYLKNNQAQLNHEKEKAIESVEQNIRTIEPKILSFIGVKSSNEYYELNESISRTSLTLDKLVVDSGELQNRKIKLLQELHHLVEILDERTQQTQQIVDLEGSLDKISSMVEQYAGNKLELNAIKDLMENIRKRLTTWKMPDDFLLRKNACVEKYMKLQEQIESIESEAQFKYDIGNSRSSQAASSFETSTYSGYVTTAYNFVAPKVSAITNNNENADNLTETSTKIEDIARAVERTNGVKELQELDDALTELAVRLKNLNYETGTKEHSTVKDLHERVENLIDIVEEKLQDNDRLIVISEEVDHLTQKLTTPLGPEEIDQIDERLNQLLLHLKKINNPSLKGHVDGCMHKIILSTGQIGDYKKSLKNTRV